MGRESLRIESALAAALADHRAGRLAAAEAAYRHILELDPREATAWHLLGLIAHQTGHDAAAVDLIQQAIALRGDVADFHHDLGLLRQRLGHRGGAIDAYSRAVELNPAHAQAQHSLGYLLVESGESRRAIEVLRRALELLPTDAEVHANLGWALLNAEEVAAAAAELRIAISLQPTLATAHNNLGMAAYRQHQLEAAAASFHTAIRINPQLAIAHRNLGVVLQKQGRLPEALRHCREAVRLQPELAQGQLDLGVTLLMMGETTEAVATLQTAIRLKPDSAVVYNTLGGALRTQGHLDAAIAAWEEALRLKPDYADAINNLGLAHLDRGEVALAIADYRRVLALQPEHLPALDNFIMALHYKTGVAADELSAAHRRWNTQHAVPRRAARAPHDNNREPGRRLRIGYVSADFREHAAARFLLPLLRAHDPNAVEVFGYSLSAISDAITHQFQALVLNWRQVAGHSEEAIARQIRDDRIDILVDLSSHTAGNGLLVFARRPAPVQVSWLAYAGSTGVETMDYRLSDPLLEPINSPDASGSEECWRLPETFWCYEPPPITTGAPRNARASDAVVFGCLNNYAKVSPYIVEAWGDILRRVGHSQLMVYAPDGHARADLLERFGGQGIDRTRLRCLGRQKLPEYLSTYNEIDIALDPHPFGGGTTTCDALWMGVPVVTLAGATPVSRAGRSLLTNAGLPELVADTRSDYVGIACELAANRARRSELRAMLRSRLERSPVMDAPRFARNFETALRGMWTRWCQSAPR
jgi:protein O-GlcNAc transferase